MSTTDLEPYRAEIERTAPLLPDVEQARREMTRYQELCSAVLVADDWIGRPGEAESFVKKSGWAKLAKFYGVSVELVGETILERDADGKLLRASAKARAIDRDGRRRDGGGACGRNEPRFVNARGRQKIEHDLPATAETRAENRAIANLIGFGAVSAEEVADDVRAGASTLTVPDWAADIHDDAIDRLEQNLATILDATGLLDPGPAVVAVGNGVTSYCDGVFPAAAARLAHLLAQAITQNAPDAAPDPEGAAT